MGYKICPSCGSKNPEHEIVCSNCMADLSGVEVTYQEGKNTAEGEPLEDKTVVVSDHITLVGDGFQIIVKSGDVVGRQGVGAEYLNSFKTVSRRHARFYREGDQWFIEDAGSTNGTFVNDRPISTNQRYEIKDGDTVKLSSQVSLRVKL